MQAPSRPVYHLPNNAVWFITGCSSGIGRGLVEYLITNHPSSRIVATARNPSSLSYIPSISPNVLKLALDVTSQSSISAAIQATLSTFSRIDILINNAGYSLKGDTEMATDSDARALMDTNFWGMVDVTKAMLPIFRDVNAKEENGGKIGGLVMNISSMGGRIGYPSQAFYHASKFAMEGWTESVMKEMPADWNIHFSLIEPGGVKTNYASSSMKHTERHPAYANHPSAPTNAVIKMFEQLSSGALEFFAEPTAIADAMYQIAKKGGEIPLRVPLGVDSWSELKREADKAVKDLEEIKEVAFSTGSEKQLGLVNDLLALEGK